jgi:glycosyltransferase involved in cell wall biosynthesis
MKIGIDARMMGNEVRGIGRYVSKLLEHIALTDTENTYTVFTRKEAVGLVPKNMRTILTDVPWYGLREQRELPAIFDAEKLDLMHVPHWNAPLKLHTPLVITIHDMILWEHPSLRATTLNPLAYATKYFAYRHVVSRNARKAKKILTVSESAKAAVMRTLHTPAEKIVVTPLGVEPFPPTITPYSLPPTPYVLSVGSGYPHKNLSTFFRVADDLMNDDQTLHAVIVGTDPAFLPKLKRQAEKIFLGNFLRVHFVGVVTDRELGALYRNARALMFTSLAEGFGLPPLEAALCGTPIIAASIDTTVETLGADCALLVPPLDINAYIGAYHQLAQDSALRARLTSAARSRATSFSWQKTAQLTRAGYGEAMHSA